MEGGNGTRCDIRPTLAPYLAPDVYPPPPCDTGNTSACVEYPDTLCVGGSCVCKGGFARLYETDTCRRAKAYMVTLVLTSIAGKYEMLPLTYDEDFRSHTTKYTNFTLRIEVSGVNLALQHPRITGDYTGSRVHSFSEKQSGIGVRIMIHLMLNSTVTQNDVKHVLFTSLNSSNGELGLSRIYTTFPLTIDQVVVSDVNECEPGVSPPINDCDANATCINRPEYFECVCNLDFKDDSDTFEFNGRNCTHKDIYRRLLELEIRRRKLRCTQHVCDTSWGLVSGVLALIFTLLLALLVLELCWRKQALTRRRRPVHVLRPDSRPRGSIAPKRVRLLNTPIIHTYATMPNIPDATENDDQDTAGLFIKDESMFKGEDNPVITTEDAA